MDSGDVRETLLIASRRQKIQAHSRLHSPRITIDSIPISHRAALLPILLRTQFPRNPTQAKRSRLRRRRSTRVPFVRVHTLQRLRASATVEVSIHRAPSSHSGLQSRHVEVDRHLAFTRKVQIPIRCADKESPADEVTDESRDHGFPNVVTHRNLWMTVPDCNGNKVHVGDNVIETESHKREGGEPDGHDLGNNLTRGDGGEDGKAHEPIRTNCPAQNLVPMRSHSLHRCESDDLCMILWSLSKDFSVAGNNSHEEQHSRKVPEKGHDPDPSKSEDADSTMEDCTYHEHDVASEEV